MKKYFTISPEGVDRVFILDDARIDTRLGSIPENSFEIWKSGKFPWISLKTEAVELLKKEKVSDLISLIQKSKSISDVEIIASAKPTSNPLQEAAEKRIKHLTN